MMAEREHENDGSDMRAEKWNSTTISDIGLGRGIGCISLPLTSSIKLVVSLSPLTLEYSSHTLPPFSFELSFPLLYHLWVQYKVFLAKHSLFFSPVQYHHRTLLNFPYYILYISKSLSLCFTIYLHHAHTVPAIDTHTISSSSYQVHLFSYIVWCCMFILQSHQGWHDSTVL